MTKIEGPAAGRGKQVMLVALLVLIGVGFFLARESLSLENLSRHEAALMSFRDKNPVLVYGLAFSLYVLVTGLSLPGATGMTLMLAWFFGFWRALILVSFASTTGATVAFLLSRYLLRDSIQNKFGDRLQAFDDALKREGAFYLFTLRLIPAVPFFVINVVMGLTPIRARTYWWVSQLGMFPGTCVYVYAGSAVPNLQTLARDGVGAVLSPTQLTQLLVAFALLGIFPLIARKVLQRLAPRRQSKPVQDAKSDKPYQAPANPYHPPESSSD